MFASDRARRRPLCVLAIALAMTAWMVPAAASAAHTKTFSRQDVVDNHYIVVLEDFVSVDAILSLHESLYEIAPRHLYRYALVGYSARMNAATAALIAQRPEVAWVEADRVMRIAAQTLPTGVDRVDADKNSAAAIDGTDTRVNVDVAVLDTGIDLDHPDLNVHQAGARSCVLLQPSADDSHGHGTHVAGTVGALDNATGVVGVAPGARLWPVKVLTSLGAGLGSDGLCGIDYVTANASAIEVANISISGNSVFGDEQDDRNCGNTDGDSYHRAICRSVAAGVTYVVAGGNQHTDAKYVSPAAYDEVITVSALTDGDGQPGGRTPICNDADDTFANYSNFGADIDLIAPGTCIYSTLPGGGYGNMSGTSMASPHVAGAAALHAAANPNATPAETRNALVARGSSDWTWPSEDGDGIKEPLLYLGDPAAPAPSPTSAPAPPTTAPSPTPTPATSPSPTPSPTPSGTPTTSPSPTPRPSTSASPQPSSAPSPTPTAEPSPSSSPASPALRGIGFDLGGHLRARGVVSSSEPSCAASVAVKIQRQTGGRWVTVHAVVTGADGQFRARIPDRPGTYRAKAPGDSACAMAKSIRQRHRH